MQSKRQIIIIQLAFRLNVFLHVIFLRTEIEINVNGLNHHNRNQLSGYGPMVFRHNWCAFQQPRHIQITHQMQYTNLCIQLNVLAVQIIIKNDWHSNRIHTSAKFSFGIRFPRDQNEFESPELFLITIHWLGAEKVENLYHKQILSPTKRRPWIERRGTSNNCRESNEWADER